MWKKLLEQARQKANAAKAILEGETPNVEEADKLLAEAEALRKQADAIKKATGLADGADADIRAFDLAAQQPAANSGIVVTGDAADRALAGNPFKAFGEFLMAVKNAGPGNVDKRLLPLRDAEDGYSINGAMGDEFVGGMVKSRFARKQTGLNEGNNALGGFLVGTDQGGSLLQRVYNVGELLRRVDMVGISPNANGMVFNAVNETARADGSRRGGILAYWTAEAGTKVPSHPAFRALELRLRKLVGLVYATDELLQDASALESWIMSNLPEELRYVAENAIINGTGVGQPQGILASGAVVPVAGEVGQAVDTIVTENVENMWSRMWAPSRRNAVWLINQDCEPQLMRMTRDVGTGGMPVMTPPGGLTAAPYSTIFGKPVIPCEYCQTVGTLGDILLVDLSEYQMIEKGGMQSASSIHLQFLTDETVFRFVYRVDGRSKWNAPLAPANSALTQSPFIALATR